MARRKQSGLAEDFAKLVAKLPWWAGVGLAALSYVLLHRLAAQPVDVVAQPGRMSAMVIQGVLKGLANIGQYLLPVLCLAGAVASAWQRHVRKRLVDSVALNNASDALDGMSWQQFEMLVAEGFRLQGYRVIETGGGGADGGVDLVLSKPSTNGTEKLLVQCKQWRAFKVGVDVVRELYGVMAARGATGGFVVTSGRYTDEAISFANGRNVTLIDGAKLHAHLQRARASASRSTAAGPPTQSPTHEKARTENPLTCPLCSRHMVRRTAKRGANAGGEFWGCSGYPSCRGTRPIT